MFGDDFSLIFCYRSSIDFQVAKDKTTAKSVVAFKKSLSVLWHEVDVEC